MSNSLTINTPNIVKQNTPLRNVPSGSTAEPDNNVKYVPQTLTEAQQAQARQNIGAGVPQVQSDWNQTDTTAPDYIKNKPAVSEDIIADKNDVITIYSDRTTTYTFNDGEMLDIWRNGVHTKLGNVGDTIRSVELGRGKNVLKFNGLFGTEFSDKTGNYTIVCPVNAAFNSLLWGTYTGNVNAIYYGDDVSGGGWWMNTEGSKTFNMNNYNWSGIWTNTGDVVFVDKSMNSLGDGLTSEPTFTANYYVPKSRYNEFITKMETIFASSYIDILKTKITQYDFLTFSPDCTPNIVVLPTLPLTMTDANNNTISGDFVAQNITIS